MRGDRFAGPSQNRGARSEMIAFSHSAVLRIRGASVQLRSRVAWRLAVRTVPLLALCGLLPFEGVCAEPNAEPGHVNANRSVVLVETSPTPVAGPSWLQRLRLSYDLTAMGRTGRYYNPREDGPPDDVPLWNAGSPQETVLLTGRDLYRFNCQGCHRADAGGYGTEINALIDPVRATSAEVIQKRMQERGAPITDEMAATMASQADASVRKQIREGGKKMPAFSHLTDLELDSLLAYLKELVGVPGSKAKQVTLREPGIRVGEHIVKGTCHICHDATETGFNRFNGYSFSFGNWDVPPLASLPQRASAAQFARKVTEGAGVLLENQGYRLRGKMPVFDYLSRSEAAWAYMYLSLTPPDRAEQQAAASLSRKPVRSTEGTR